MKVLNFGSLNYDYVYKVDHAVTPGETMDSFGMDTFLGGKGIESVHLTGKGRCESIPCRTDRPGRRNVPGCM